METDSFGRAHLLAANLVLVVALVHLGMGTVEWLRYAAAGFLVPRDVRWPVFVLSGLALLVGLFVAPRIRRRRPLYAGGIVVALGYVVGYFGWHLGGHRPLILLGPGTHHHQPFVPFLLGHLFAGPIEFLAIVAELALAVVLGYLFVVDR